MKPGDPPKPTPPDRDLIDLHTVVLRELPEPEEGRERGPWWLWTAILITIFGGGFYLGRFSGTFFENAVHVGYIRPHMVARPQLGASGLPAAPAEPAEVLGPRVYAASCIACHQGNGKGVPNSYPTLVGTPWVTRDEATLVRILLKGLSGPITVEGIPYNGAMPGWETILSNERIAAVASYVRTNFGNQASAVSVETVQKLRDAHKDRSATWTAAELEQLREKQ